MFYSKVYTKISNLAFDAGCEYVGERNFIDSEGYMDFHEDYEIEAPNFEKWIKNNAFKINKIK